MFGLNKKSMLRHGTIGALTFVIIILIWGLTYAFIAFPLALTSLALSKQNITINTFRKALRLMFTYSIIVTFSYIASINPFLGIPINFICIFLIGYVFTINFNPTLYKPFLMLYVFTSFGETSISILLTKIFIVNFGVVLVVLSERIIHQRNDKNILITLSKKSLALSKDILSLTDEKERKSLHLKNLALTRELFYKIYITRFKNILTTYLGKIQFSLNLNLLSLSNACFSSSFEEYEKKEILKDIENLKNGEYSFSSKLAPLLNSIKIDMEKLNSLSKKEEKKLSKDLSLSEEGALGHILKEDFKIGTIRMNFALRLSILLTFSIFIGNYLNFYKIIWISITIMSIIYPYYENTKNRIFDRLKGNILGIIAVTFVTAIIHSNFIIFIILVLSIFFTYGFKDYKKLSFCTTIASLCASSFSNPLSDVIIIRLFYVLLGVFLVFIGNNFLFPYTLDKGILHLSYKILHLTKLICEERLEETPHLNIIADTTILAFLYMEKLHLRNLQYASDEVNEFIIIESKVIASLTKR